MKRHQSGWIGCYLASPPSFLTHFLHWSALFSLCICLLCPYRIASVCMLPSSAGFSPAFIIVAGLFVQGRWESWTWSRSAFCTQVEAGRVRVGFVTQRRTEDGLDQGKGLDHGDTVSTLGTYFIILINQLQRVSSAVDLPAEWLEPGAPRTSMEIKKLPMPIERRERGSEIGNKAMGESQRE